MNDKDTIYRQAAIDSARQGLCDFFGLNADDFKFPITNTDYLAWALNKNITAQISSLPSAQPEIIRCKDCKHWGFHIWLDIPWCREMHIDRGAEDFCSMAERRESDGRLDQQTVGD